MNSSYYTLLRALTISDFKLRYHDSLLGILWSFLKPLFLFSILYTVFSVFMHFPIPHYGLYLLLGIIIWNFFTEATTLSLRSLVQKAPLIRKIYFPREILVLSSTLIALMNFGLSLFIFWLFALFAGVYPSFSLLLLILWVTELYFLTLGVSLGLSALNAKFKDIEHIWELLLPLGLWVTPIVYSIEMVPTQYHWLFLYNPMAIIVQSARQAVLGGSLPAVNSLAITGVIVLLVFAFGYWIFQIYAPSFAEEL